MRTEEEIQLVADRLSTVLADQFAEYYARHGALPEDMTILGPKTNEHFALLGALLWVLGRDLRTVSGVSAAWHHALDGVDLSP